MKATSARDEEVFANAPARRIHFAGEHTSTWFLRGSMQGAPESGVRAAREEGEAAART